MTISHDFGIQNLLSCDGGDENYSAGLADQSIDALSHPQGSVEEQMLTMQLNIDKQKFMQEEKAKIESD